MKKKHPKPVRAWALVGPINDVHAQDVYPHKSDALYQQRACRKLGDMVAKVSPVTIIPDRPGYETVVTYRRKKK